MNGITEVELIARHHIAERSHQRPQLPRQARRTRIAGTLRQARTVWTVDGSRPARCTAAVIVPDGRYDPIASPRRQ